MGRYADAQEMLEGRRQGASPAEIRAYRNIRFLNITAAMPVLLWLFTKPPSDNEHDREMAVRAIESFVVRRMAVKWWTRGLPAAFARVLKDACGTPQSPGRAVIAALQAGPRGFTWPTDQDLESGFCTGRHYGPGGIGQPRLRLLLGTVDRNLRSLGEPKDVDYEKCHVEHILPQEWKEHWSVDGDLDENARVLAEQRRTRHVHRIGNLTLVGSRLNTEMRNSAWPIKKLALEKHSLLTLNQHLCKHSDWNEESIVDRGAWLAKRVSEAWPGPEDAAWNLIADA